MNETELQLHDAISPGATSMAMGYSATDTDDALVIHRVPIFVECERDGINFDAAWIGAAVSKAMKRQRGGYMPPLHVRHHNDGEAPIAAGFFKVTGTGIIDFQGTRRSAVLADLIITDPGTRAEVMAKRLPYRSVEIFDVAAPGFDSLALLDHEAPFLELPMGFVNKVKNEATGKADDTVRIRVTQPGRGASDDDANANFRMTGSVNGGPVVASFSHGSTSMLLFRHHPESEPITDQDMTTKAKTPEELAADAAAATQQAVADAAAATNFEADGDKPPAGGDDDDKEDKDMEAAAVDVSTIVKAIADGSIPVKAMDELLAAIQEAQSKAAQPEPEPEAAPAGAEAMSKNPDAAKIVTMQAQIDALKANDERRDAEVARDKDVDSAFDRLKDRPLGANLRAKLADYHTKFGAEAFKVHVDTLAETVHAIPSDTDPDSMDFRATGGADSEAVMKFAAKEGVSDAQAQRARHFSRVWRDLNSRGMVRQSEDRYIEVNMQADALFTPAV